MNWTEKINISDLEKSVFKGSRFEYIDLTYDELGQEVALEMYPGESGSGAGKSIWQIIKTEFRLLMCEKDSKYNDLREKLDKVSGGSSTAFVAIISAGFGAAIGTAATIISPLISILIIAFVRIGKETFCSYTRLNAKVLT